MLLEKILDNYYTKKLKQEIVEQMMEYNLEYKIFEDKKCIILEVKNPKLKDYKPLFSIRKCKSFIFISNREQSIREMQSLLEKYCKSHQVITNG